MKSMWVVMAAAVAFGGWRFAEAQSAAPIEQQVVLNDDAARVLKDLNPGSLRLTARRYSSRSAAEESYKRLESALADLAASRDVRNAGNGGEASLLAEIDSTFYVYTNRFNARLVRLAEYTEAQTASATGGPSVAADKPVDVLRIAAGALGIVRGWISPSFGSYMMAGGAAPALFGSGVRRGGCSSPVEIATSVASRRSTPRSGSCVTAGLWLHSRCAAGRKGMCRLFGSTNSCPPTGPRSSANWERRRRPAAARRHPTSDAHGQSAVTPCVTSAAGNGGAEKKKPRQAGVQVLERASLRPPKSGKSGCRGGCSIAALSRNLLQ